MNYPRLEIDSSKIKHNAQTLIHQLGLKGISVTPVTKVCLGHPVIAQILVNAGAKILADSRIENIEKIKKSGITIPAMLIRSPMLSQVKNVIQYCDISLNTELVVIRALSAAASKLNITHDIIIMVELGDLREGVMPIDLLSFIENITHLPHITLRGIGSNLACRYGVSPDDNNMSQLSDLADEIDRKFDMQLDIISGGNSASLNWAFNNTKPTRVNDLRLGEAIFLGCEALYQEHIKGLFNDVITLTAEVIESKIKPSQPWGKRAVNAFGEKPHTDDRGAVSQAILALGRQDVSISGITPPEGITIVSSTSDHLIIETSGKSLIVGQKINFKLNYSALLFAMTSPFVHKYFLTQLDGMQQQLA
ncbi:MAG: alanine/ornithine racemase family PLP-dependent enzyme [Moritella sp.]|uniref:alanine/ornithine racemase family PLP-dependent enzyme n=1 Tax=Moritella sp. TaxID=78556 RepID=UPI0029A0B9A2|nr:alanine/ornithine racemase family PLP-dependent enzyme [Moritella sp.]MDX2321890.1 alanine/ornithine racemase family PLP-dependent enzyme [Moritella sp.]